MKRLVYLISTFFILTGMYGGSVGAGEIFWITDQPEWRNHKIPAREFSVNESQMSGSDIKEYVKWAKRNSDMAIAWGYALALSPKGWAAGLGQVSMGVRQATLRNCKRHLKSNDCKIIDVDGKSAFIKQRGSSGSTTTASSSSSTSLSSTSEVWCATRQSVYYTTNASCLGSSGKGYLWWYQAEAERKRLKAAPPTASSSDSQQVWCATPRSVWSTIDLACAVSKGKAFPSESLAKAEHKRLKSASSSASGSGSKKVWCATSTSVWSTIDSACSSSNGKAFTSETLAETEHIRLKAGTSGSVATSGQITQTTTAKTKSVDSSLELEFWKSVKDSTDPDMFREYLRQFPDGVYAGLAKLKVKKLGGTSTLVAQSSIPNLDYGRYHALVIGNDRYRHLKPLSTAVNDANAVASLLRSRYQFNVDVLTNATRDETVSALSKLRKTISSKDNLLIYYAGHGWLDKDMDEGFWLPVDAVDDDQVDWIANDTIMRSVRAIKAKHVMVVADSCFSGTLIRGIKIRERSPDYIKRMSEKKARTALTSGGIEPVTDVGGGDHSIFAATFMRILNENTSVLDGHQLFTTLRKQVMMNADQTPEYGDIRKAGHDGGDFLFVRQ